jgi:hypothetical protein
MQLKKELIMLTAEHTTEVELGDELVTATVTYEYSLGYAGFNLGPAGPTDGAQPPEPPGVENIISIVRDDTKEEILDSLDGDTLERIRNNLNENLPEEDDERDC